MKLFHYLVTDSIQTSPIQIDKKKFPNNWHEALFLHRPLSFILHRGLEDPIIQGIKESKNYGIKKSRILGSFFGSLDLFLDPWILSWIFFFFQKRIQRTNNHLLTYERHNRIFT